MSDKLTHQKFVCPWWLCFTFDNPPKDKRVARLQENFEAIE